MEEANKSEDQKAEVEIQPVVRPGSDTYVFDAIEFYKTLEEERKRKLDYPDFECSAGRGLSSSGDENPYGETASMCRERSDQNRLAL